MDIPYSAERDDLYYPAKRAVFFPNGRPQSDAALCVEMALLAYCRQNTCFAFDQPRIRKILASIQFTDCELRGLEGTAHAGLARVSGTRRGEAIGSVGVSRH